MPRCREPPLRAKIAYSLGEGEISPNGWCAIYTTSSPLDRGGHT